MHIIKVRDYSQMSSLAAQLFQEQLQEKPGSAICCPTGSTPLGTYETLCAKREDINMSSAYFFNMDEYARLDESNKNSFNYFLDRNLYEPYNLRKEQINRLQYPEGATVELLEAYDATINEIGGFDLLILGIGADGHIAFNMPASVFSSGTHLEKLSKQTISDNARHFSQDEPIPEYAVTIGMKAVMSAKKILLLVSGATKTGAFKKLINCSDIDPQFPASILHLHKNVTVIVDCAAYGC